MLWKIYNIHTGKILKAGFEEEDVAKEWFEARAHLPEEDYLVEEMDQDEEEEWLESQEEANEEEEEAEAEEYSGEEEEAEAETEVQGFGDEYFDGADIDDDYMASIYDEDDVE